MATKISVLVTLYKNNTSLEIKRCFSSLANQSYKPDEIILVVDGPIELDLQSILKEFELSLFIKVKYLVQNVGLGKSLNIGLELCSCDYVARIDIDDFSRSDRFNFQKAYLDSNPNISVLGAQIELFDENGPYARRMVPTDSKIIERHSLFRNPFNHSTVIFRLESIKNIGGYPEVRFTQDYLLWINCMYSGLVCANLPDVLCEMYADKNMVKRRGLSYLKYDIMPYKKNYFLRRNGIFIYFSMVVIRTLFNTKNSLLSIFNNCIGFIYEKK
jgi:amylovoran biosynthesis glycosyltransferase AmsE